MHPKSKIAIETEGFDELVDYMREVITDEISHVGICMNEGCEYVDMCDADTRDGYCSDCDTYTLKSVLVIEGMI